MKIIYFLALSLIVSLAVCQAPKADQIKEYVNKALIAENDNDLAEALRQYYWSFILNGKEKNINAIKIQEYENKNVSAGSSNRMKKIFMEVEFKVDNVIETDSSKIIDLYVTRNDQSVKNMDIRYSLREGWSEIVKVNSGKSKITLDRKSKDQEKVKFLIEYEYIDQAKNDSVLYKYIEQSGYEFRNSDKEIVLKEKLKNNISDINKAYPANTAARQDNKQIPSKKKSIKNDKWIYAGSASAIIVGVVLVVLLNNTDGGNENPQSTDIGFEIPLHP